MRGGRQCVGDSRRATSHPRVLNGAMEEESILPKRSAERSSVVVARELSSLARLIKVVGSLEVSVPVILEDRAVELIRSCLAHHHRLTSHDAAIFSRKSVGQDPVFLNAVQSKRLAG